MKEIVESKPPLIEWGAAMMSRLRSYFPGVLASLIIAIAATFLSEHYGGPVMLFALLLGMAFYFLSQEGPCVVGIELASQRILRAAVGLLGAQITLAQILSLGVSPVVMVVGAVILTILFGVMAARVVGLDGSFGLLTAGAVAICGASAALAIASVLPKRPRSERDTVFTVIGVTTLSTVAMIVYPIIIGFFHLGHSAIGVFLGATIHDVAQVVGAGYSVSEETGNISPMPSRRKSSMSASCASVSILLTARNSGLPVRFSRRASSKSGAASSVRPSTTIMTASASSSATRAWRKISAE